MKEVLKVLCGPKAKNATTRKTVYDRLNRARNNYLHGGDVSAHQPDRLMHFAAVLCRLMLTEFLGLHRELAPFPKRKTKQWAERTGKNFALQMRFDDYQERYEKALDTFLNPPPDPRATHRRVMRPARSR